jgi:hypothetical protein
MQIDHSQVSLIREGSEFRLGIKERKENGPGPLLLTPIAGKEVRDCRPGFTLTESLVADPSILLLA